MKQKVKAVGIMNIIGLRKTALEINASDQHSAGN